MRDRAVTAHAGRLGLMVVLSSQLHTEGGGRRAGLRFACCVRRAAVPLDRWKGDPGRPVRSWLFTAESQPGPSPGFSKGRAAGQPRPGSHVVEDLGKGSAAPGGGDAAAHSGAVHAAAGWAGRRGQAGAARRSTGRASWGARAQGTRCAAGRGTLRTACAAQRSQRLELGPWQVAGQGARQPRVGAQPQQLQAREAARGQPVRREGRSGKVIPVQLNLLDLHRFA